MRGKQAHTDMLFGDVTMKATSNGKGKQSQEKARQETLELLPLRCLKHQVITINFEQTMEIESIWVKSTYKKHL